MYLFGLWTTSLPSVSQCFPVSPHTAALWSSGAKPSWILQRGFNRTMWYNAVSSCFCNQKTINQLKTLRFFELTPLNLSIYFHVISGCFSVFCPAANIPSSPRLPPNRVIQAALWLANGEVDAPTSSSSIVALRNTWTVLEAVLDWDEQVAVSLLWLRGHAVNTPLIIITGVGEALKGEKKWPQRKRQMGNMNQCVHTSATHSQEFPWKEALLCVFSDSEPSGRLSEEAKGGGGQRGLARRSELKTSPHTKKKRHRARHQHELKSAIWINCTPGRQLLKTWKPPENQSFLQECDTLTLLLTSLLKPGHVCQPHTSSTC